MKKSIRILAIFMLTGLCVYLIIKAFAIYSMIGTIVEVDSTPNNLEGEISALLLEYEDNEAAAIDLASITDFDWDRLYVFGPYTPISELDSKFGRSWQTVCFTQIGTLEGYSLLGISLIKNQDK